MTNTAPKNPLGRPAGSEASNPRRPTFAGPRRCHRRKQHQHSRRFDPSVRNQKRRFIATAKSCYKQVLNDDSLLNWIGLDWIELHRSVRFFLEDTRAWYEARFGRYITSKIILFQIISRILLATCS